MPYYFWADIKAGDFNRIREVDAVAVVPVGAIEQHGPHLPLSTDTVLAETIAAEAARRVTRATVLVLPVVAYGKSDEHLSFPGVLTLDARTLGDVLLQIGKGVARSGIRRVVFLNAHGGNVPVLQIVSRALRIESGMLSVTAGWMSMGYPPGLVTPLELQEGIHGGFVETAAMLHVRPDLVDMSRAKHFVPASQAVAEANQVFRMMGPVSAGWVAEDLHPAGVAGDAASASAEAGKAIVEHAATRYATLLEEVAAHPIDTIEALR